MGCNSSKPESQEHLYSQPAPTAKPINERPMGEKHDPVVEGDYQVTLRRSKDSTETLGMRLVNVGRVSLKVRELKAEGLVPLWNQRHIQSPDMLVAKGDIIVAVNKTSGNCNKMLARLNDKVITMTFKRPDDVSDDCIHKVTSETETSDAYDASEPLRIADIQYKGDPFAAEIDNSRGGYLSLLDSCVECDQEDRVNRPSLHTISRESQRTFVHEVDILEAVPDEQTTYVCCWF